MLLQQVGHYHTIPILVSSRRDPEGAVGMSARHCVTSSVEFFHPVRELCIRVAGPGRHCPLKFPGKLGCIDSCSIDTTAIAILAILLATLLPFLLFSLRIERRRGCRLSPPPAHFYGHSAAKSTADPFSYSPTFPAVRRPKQPGTAYELDVAEPAAGRLAVKPNGPVTGAPLLLTSSSKVEVESPRRDRAS